MMATVEEMMANATYSPKIGGSVFNQDTRYQPAVQATKAIRTPNQAINEADIFGSNAMQKDINNSIAGINTPAVPAVGASPTFGASDVTYANNPSSFNTTENSSAWYDPFSFGDYGQDAGSATLKQGLNPDGSAMNAAQKKDQSLANLYDTQAANVGTSWNDWANIGLGSIGTGMQMSMHGDKKDYLSGSVDALEQSTANSQEAHDTKMANNASYGSAFSKV